MDVLVVGMQHRTAPLWIRERVAFASLDGAAAEVGRAAGVAEALVLSTCNRVELYAASGEPTGVAAERLMELLAARAAMPVDVLRGYVYVHAGVDAARHLARVAAGADSMVLGETQIAAQIRRGVAAARAGGALGRVLHRLVQTALAAGKRARPLLPAGGRRAQSVAEAAVHALGGVGALADVSVVVLGAGETASDVLRALAGARPRRVVVVNRTLAHALPLAAKHGAAVASWEALGVVVADADVVFACAAASAPVIDAAHLDAAHLDVAHLDAAHRAAAHLAAPRESRPRTFVDLGVPRNVAPAVAALPGTRVLDVDTLGRWEPRDSERDMGRDLHAAEQELDRWARRFARWLRAQDALPTILALRAGAEHVREREVERALAQLARLGPLSARERDVVRGMAARLVAKLLHGPLHAMAGDDEPGALASTARRLFGMDVPRDAAGPESHRAHTLNDA